MVTSRMDIFLPNLGSGSLLVMIRGAFGTGWKGARTSLEVTLTQGQHTRSHRLNRLQRGLAESLIPGKPWWSHEEVQATWYWVL